MAETTRQGGGKSTDSTPPASSSLRQGQEALQDGRKVEVDALARGRCYLSERMPSESSVDLHAFLSTYPYFLPSMLEVHTFFPPCHLPYLLPFSPLLRSPAPHAPGSLTPSVHRDGLVPEWPQQPADAQQQALEGGGVRHTAWRHSGGAQPALLQLPRPARHRRRSAKLTRAASCRCPRCRASPGRLAPSPPHARWAAKEAPPSVCATCTASCRCRGCCCCCSCPW